MRKLFSSFLGLAARNAGGAKRQIEQDAKVQAALKNFTDRQAEQAEDHLRLKSIISLQYELASGGTDLDQLMSLVVARAGEMTNASGAVIEIAEGDEMVYRSASGGAAGQIGLRLKQATSLSGLSVRSGQVLICADAFTDPRVDQVACKKVGVRSMVVVPLRHRRKVVGALKVYSPLPSAFSQEQQTALELISGFLGAIFDRATTLDVLR